MRATSNAPIEMISCAEAGQKYKGDWRRRWGAMAFLRL